MSPASTTFRHVAKCVSPIETRCAGPGQSNLLSPRSSVPHRKISSVVGLTKVDLIVMPANLTPQYLKAEEKYRQAQTPQARLQGLEAMLQLIPRHKGTDRLQGELRARLKELRAEIHAEQLSGRSGQSGRIPRQGAGTVVVIGPPNSGKSRVLQELTSAAPIVAPYPFTTRQPQAGMMTWEDIQFQLIDTPPIVRTHLETSTLNFIRAADLVLLCLNGSDPATAEALRDVQLELRNRKTQLSHQTGFDKNDFSIVHVRTIGLLTHGNTSGTAELLQRLRLQESTPFIVIAADLDQPADVARLRIDIAGSLPVLRIYTRRPGDSQPDPVPTTLPPGSTIEDLAAKIHHDLTSQLKYAKVWNRDSAMTGKTVNRDGVLQDRDLVELYI